MSNKVITRYAPSPTGLPHLGTTMYALLNYIYARQNNGEVIMRSEDTDPIRSKPEFEEAIKEGLAWVGIKFDKFVRQSERKDIYKKYIAKMVEEKTAYISREKNEEGIERDLVRFKNPNKIITFHDMARGDISVDTTDLEDFIIARDINSPLYHLTVVVDDFEMGITHIIRGEDGLANTPRQILIQEAIGAPRPIYAHYPFVLMSNKKKMGKRNGAVSLQDYRAQGYLPEAIINFTMLLAWHPKDDRELFLLEDLIKEFQLERIGKSGAILGDDKLNWFNKEYIKKLSESEFLKKAKSYINPDTKIIKKLSESEFDKLILQFRERINKFNDLNNLILGSANTTDSSFFSTTTEHLKTTPDSSIIQEKTIIVSGPNDYLLKDKDPIINDIKILIPKDVRKEDVVIYLKNIKDLIEKNDWGKIIEKNDENNLWMYASKEGRGKVLWPLRVALSGELKSSDPFEIMKLIDKDSSLRRIEKGIEKLIHLH
ncbi:hypothetical protein A2641_03825 [Candidatus Nomurabacteria bacterium RIFCSPHIGHO2_01_FULL_37_25]|uniref:Glutamate--tRNA ligase n=1 Tax=Candidatus Nomurabacteria bacterium RIFCSPLOWO2_01_FULL_36_16 TaxID=1801767 RepID=A0A1F6WYK8_9BACT|nr:MAG: hypothetical protein A2641_03825 [Candidatus Nomurabacteria bacterium RIFCSPHIGHO2_01_FULL_37_25]OGI75160.1 MAG: hypothetical protein A3D36_00980 [Candidatus Nomurabacteria bacterium RIFCSPHIGHO2_02_FULL_36_29]OGI86815.1 MAG: hypothetical protein A3A91_01190 [Candidatus Nomurabacteria bacterium RIFCSPLOWO2_01_FULL_36_16]OGI95293.1 MAG: hypothetical protein A3I84_01750 [Candidatus Nomurabacteria bacterium RIFCSPLOWO2_02_FULL_36_8]